MKYTWTEKRINPPRFLNEWMDDLLDKIDPNDPTTSRICAFMVGMMQAPWNKIEGVNLRWIEIEDLYGEKTNILPNIDIKFRD